MLVLPPNPSHVLMPSEIELADVGEPTGRWRPEACPLCHGTGQFNGYVPDSNTEWTVWQCDCTEQLVLRRWFMVRRLGGFARTLRHADLVDLSPDAKAWAERYFSSLQSSLDIGIGAYLFGSMGSGKSSVATMMVKEFLLAGIDAYVIDGTNVMSDIQNWGDKEKMARWLHRVFSVPVLLFDEFGKETGHPESVRTQIDRIIQQRLANRLVTIITSNLRPDQMRQRFGEFAIDAVAGQGDLVDCSIAESWRNGPKDQQRRDFEKVYSIKRPSVFR